MAQAPKHLIRRLIRFEYNNTIRDLLGDSSLPGNALPAEQSGNGFGNDSFAQPVSNLLVQQYSVVAGEVAARAASPASIGTLLPCAGAIGAGSDPATEAACVTSFVHDFAPRAYRRPLLPGEPEELTALFQAVRSGGADFPSAIAALVEGILQTPQFLYRPELGVAVEGRPELRRPAPHEMAARLSYLLWGTMPDETLLAAAQAGELGTAESVAGHARRMLEDPRARAVTSFFFDNLLPISALSALERDPLVYPTYSAQIGALLREETQTFLAHEIFEAGSSWPSILTAPYTFVNEPLAAYYGMTGVTGPEFRQVPLDTTRRLGLLTQGGVVAGSIHSNNTNPVVRGAFIVRKMLCQPIPLPTGDIAEQIKPPDPYSGRTARERYSAHSQQGVCQGCHQLMDPIGLALENYDAVGLWRDTENDVVIDARGEMPALGGAFDGPIELARKVAESELSKACFAEQWMSFAYGRQLLEAEEPCTAAAVKTAFERSGYNVKELLVALTQSDAFLYLPAPKE